MIEVGGKTVLTELHEIAAPAHTALVVVDVQNDYCDERGALARHGADVSAYRPMIARLRPLIDAAREAGVLVAFVRATRLPNDLARSPAQILFELRMQATYAPALDEPLVACVRGTWGHEVVDGLGWRPEDFTVDKHRSSAFVGTNLDVVLRSSAIRTVVVAGCTTEGCVDSTVRDAGFLDYYPVLVRDCVASDDPALHEAALRILEAYRAFVADGPELARIWGAR